jgi:hypothetical protein
MKFREHRGTLDDSMLTCVEVDDFVGLVKHLQKIWGEWSLPIIPGALKIEHYCYDGRIGWNTYIVTMKGQVLGFTDGPLEYPHSDGSY